VRHTQSDVSLTLSFYNIESSEMKAIPVTANWHPTVSASVFRTTLSPESVEQSPICGIIATNRMPTPHLASSPSDKMHCPFD